MSDGPSESQLADFHAHMNRCITMIIGPMRHDTKVTIIVRSPEALPEEAMISTNDSLAVARDAMDYFMSKGSVRKED